MAKSKKKKVKLEFDRVNVTEELALANKSLDEAINLAAEMHYKNGIKYYILKKVKNEADADDLTHEVLLKVYNSCCSGKTINNVRSWLFQIAHNTTIDFIKKHQNMQWYLLLWP